MTKDKIKGLSPLERYRLKARRTGWTAILTEEAIEELLKENKKL